MAVYKNSSNSKMPMGRDQTNNGSNGNGGRAQSSPNSQKGKVRTKEATRRQSMLNTHKIAPFKYDMNEILASTQMDEAKASAFLATLIAKASRLSTKEAKEFVRSFMDTGDLTKDECDRINRLMDKYSKYR